MSYFYRLSCTLLLLFHFQNVLIAQTDQTIVTHDLETWTSVGFKFKPTKKIAFGLNQQMRRNHNASLTDQIITDLDVKYKFDHFLYLGAALRYIADSKDEDFENKFRFNLDLGLKHDINRFSFDYRLRYQNKNEIGISKSEGDESDNIFRLKVGVDYNIKKWKLDPQFSTELFSDLSEESDKLAKIRFTFGTDYTLNKAHKIGAFYRLEREINEAYPKTTYIIGLNYTYTLKLKR
ncbi:DUF2490 domain-containing protein [Putridiphycobacter roseus]|uniref:DUF2490 domain-containing protein n=1 Tax=Putridiphycobacter roseus TaxID=2219161 RepID=UPI0013148EC6|nr:DUF2490 domain-containing protein [Putridiphycobacter roseus]